MLFAPHAGIDVTNDTRLVRWARRHRRILVRHDTTPDKRTRLELYPEIYKNGGKLICVHGGPQQDPLISLGKILAHLDKWLAFFGANAGGVVVVGAERIRYMDKEYLLSQVQSIMKLDIEHIPAKVKPSRKRPKRPRRKPPPEQMELRRKGVPKG